MILPKEMRPGAGHALGSHSLARTIERSREVAVLDVHARGQQRGLAQRAQRADQLGIVEDLGGARHAQRLAGRRHERDQADLAGRQDAEAKGQIVADTLGDQQGLGILDPDEARLVALGRDFDGAVGGRRADQGEGQRFGKSIDCSSRGRGSCCASRDAARR